MNQVDHTYKTMKSGQKASQAAREMGCEAEYGCAMVIFLGIILVIACLL